MNILDALILTPLLYAFYKGFSNGFVKEILGIVGVVVAVFLTFAYLDALLPLLEQGLGLSGQLARFLSGTAIFLGTIFVFNLVAALIKRLLQFAQLNVINRILGGAFSALKVSILVSVLLLLLSFVSVPTPQAREESVTYPIIIGIAPAAFNFISFFIPNGSDFLTRMKELDPMRSLPGLPSLPALPDSLPGDSEEPGGLRLPALPDLKQGLDSLLDGRSRKEGIDGGTQNEGDRRAPGTGSARPGSGPSSPSTKKEII